MNNSNNDRFEEQSVASSRISSASKHGKYVPKHCIKCENKLFKRWGDHVMAKHNGDKTIKGIDCRTESCHICFDQEVRSEVSNSSKKSDRHTKTPCSECNELKRTNTLDKVSGKCMTCINNDKSRPFKQPKTAKSVIVPKKSSKQSNPLSKRAAARQPFLQLVQRQGCDYNGMHIDATESEQDTQSLSSSLKRMRLEQGHLSGLPSLDKSSLLLPLPTNTTKQVVIDQSMKDMGALQVLMDIEEKGLPPEDNEAKLASILPLLCQDLLVAYLTRAPRPHVLLALLSLQKNVIVFTEQQIVAVAFTSVILGNQAWSNLPWMFTQLEARVRINVLEVFSIHLSARFGADISNWISRNWQYLAEQTLQLIWSLNQRPSLFAATILDISRCVNSSDGLDSFRETCEAFICAKEIWCMFIDAFNGKSQQARMTLSYFKRLYSEMRKNQN